MAGRALNILTNAPDTEPAAELKRTGGNDSLFQAKGMATGELTDGLAGRLAFITRDTESVMLGGEYTEDDLTGPAARNYEGEDPGPILEGLGLGDLVPFLLHTSPDTFDIEAGVDGSAKREMSAATLQIEWDLDIGLLTPDPENPDAGAVPFVAGHDDS